MPVRPAFPLPSAGAARWLTAQLRDETVGGVLIGVAAVVALVWANSPWGDTYRSLLSTELGPEQWHLRLSLAKWASDGLLAIFFIVVGLELRHELETGSLSQPSRAVVPIAAALGGMAVPAVFYLIPNLIAHDGRPEGWGIPMATDIAFALAVLAVAGRGLPMPLRAFLLTSAIVDDIGAITIIALFYSEGIALLPLGMAAALLAGYAGLQRMGGPLRFLCLPVALGAWVALHASGVHATIAGVVIGFVTSTRIRRGESESAADRLEHRLLPISAGVATPLFALTAAGVALDGFRLEGSAPVLIGVLLGLAVGKPLGVFGTAMLVARWTSASLADGMTWRDVAAVSMLSGIGFTVALLIAGLALPSGPLLEAAKLGILGATVLMGSAAAVLLRSRVRTDQA